MSYLLSQGRKGTIQKGTPDMRKDGGRGRQIGAKHDDMYDHVIIKSVTLYTNLKVIQIEKR